MSNEFYYEMLNQSLKGIISGLGSGSGPTKKAIVVKLSKEIEPGEQVISENLIEFYKNKDILYTVKLNNQSDKVSSDIAVEIERYLRESNEIEK